MNSNLGLEGVGRAVGPYKVPRTAGRVRRKEGGGGRGPGERGIWKWWAESIPHPGWAWGGRGDLLPSQALSLLLTPGPAHQSSAGSRGAAWTNVHPDHS